MFNILAPIFGLIALAYASRKVNILRPSAYVELNRYVASLALPALSRVIKLLAASAGPCALVAHGLFLARDDSSNARPWVAATRPRPLALVSLKLLAQPVITGLLAIYAFGLAGMDAQLVIILSALPTGTGAFMLADVYERDLEVTSTTIMLSTILSALSLSLCLTILPRIL